MVLWAVLWRTPTFGILLCHMSGPLLSETQCFEYPASFHLAELPVGWWWQAKDSFYLKPGNLFRDKSPSFESPRSLENRLSGCINWNCTQIAPKQMRAHPCLQGRRCVQVSTHLRGPSLFLQRSAVVTSVSSDWHLILAGFCGWLMKSS